VAATAVVFLLLPFLLPFLLLSHLRLAAFSSSYREDILLRSAHHPIPKI